MFEDSNIEEVVSTVEHIASTTGATNIDIPTLLSSVSEHLGYGANFAWDTLVFQFRILGAAELFALLIVNVIMVVAITKLAKKDDEKNPFFVVLVGLLAAICAHTTVTYMPEALTQTLNPEYHAITKIAELTAQYVR